MRCDRTETVKRRSHGTATLELGLLLPILVTLALALVQVVVYLQSATATQYAAFVAARAYQVYGDRTLGSIGYKRVREPPYTHKGQTIAEAAAEKVIFESLMWEQKRIAVAGGPVSLDRYYNDGVDLARNGVSADRSEGVVRVNLLTGQGVEVTYCMPILFPGIDRLFASLKKEYPCKTDRIGANYTGMAVSKAATFGREPAEL